ncbi:MAG: type VI secretion system tube protein Hcp [Phycisphaerae bacterium]|nr:type VI secretion system tube protein Hcp [Phycisphaerae bacterium]
MTIVRKSVGIVCGMAAVGLLVIVWGLNAGPLDPSAPPASTMKSMQELYDLTNSMKGAALPAPLVSRSTDMFLWVDGIPGESMDDKHRDYIDAMAYHYGVSRPGRSFPTSGAPEPAADHADLTVVKAIDKASPKLFLACCTGQHIKQVRFDVFRPGGAPTRIIGYTMTDVMITSVKPVGAVVGTAYLMEEVSFNYAQIEVRYTEIDPATGKPKGDVIASWDRQIGRGG